MESELSSHVNTRTAGDYRSVSTRTVKMTDFLTNASCKERYVHIFSLVLFNVKLKIQNASCMY